MKSLQTKMTESGSALGKERGFTLIEVMVALTIFAFCAVSMYFVLSQSVDSYGKIERKTLGTWIAENRLTELRLQPEFPSAGDSSDELEYADREWVINTVVHNTEDPDMRRVEVSVNLRLPNTRDPVFVTALTGFVGKS